MIDHAHLPWNQYLKKIGGVLKQQTFVGRLDYNDLLKYLRGETATSKQVRKSHREVCDEGGAMLTTHLICMSINILPVISVVTD